jgi:signal peptidase II
LRTDVHRGIPSVVFWVWALSVLAVDQGSKFWASRKLAFGGSRDLLPGFLGLVYTKNQGIAFGLLAGRSWVIWVIVAAAFLGGVAGWQVVPWGRKEAQRVAGAFVGAALGNLLDRIWRGGVVDFIDLHVGPYHWPAFNVADAVLSCAVAWALWLALAPSWNRDHLGTHRDRTAKEDP